MAPLFRETKFFRRNVFREKIMLALTAIDKLLHLGYFEQNWMTSDGINISEDKLCIWSSFKTNIAMFGTLENSEIRQWGQSLQTEIF